MNKILCLFLWIGSAISLQAENLDLVFRYYDSDGKMVASPLEISADSLQIYRVNNADKSGWQHWSVSDFNGSGSLQIRVNGVNQELKIDVHPDFRNKLKSLVINRLQAQGAPLILKVNHLTCKWTGGIAYPMEYTFINPLDGVKLKLEKNACNSGNDSADVKLHVLSDSVLLFTCNDNEALFFKYYLRSDKSVSRAPSNIQCQVFYNENQRQLYELLMQTEKRISYSFENNRLTLFDGRCFWVFRME